jgi:hypothetical protein
MCDVDVRCERSEQKEKKTRKFDFRLLVFPLRIQLLCVVEFGVV